MGQHAITNYRCRAGDTMIMATAEGVSGSIDVSRHWTVHDEKDRCFYIE